MDLSLLTTQTTTKSRGALYGLFASAPVWVACLCFAEIALLGYLPALRERARLDTDREELVERAAAEQERGTELRRSLRAYHDPIYAARRAKSLVDPARDGSQE